MRSSDFKHKNKQSKAGYEKIWYKEMGQYVEERLCYEAFRQLKPPHGCVVKPETSDSLSWWFSGVCPHTHSPRKGTNSAGACKPLIHPMMASDPVTKNTSLQIDAFRCSAHQAFFMRTQNIVNFLSRFIVLKICQIFMSCTGIT